MHTSHFRHRLVEFWAVGIAFFSLINFTQGADAIQYGSGNYSGTCSYGCTGTPSTSTTTDTATGSTTTTSSSGTTSSSQPSTSTTATNNSLIASITEPKQPINLDPYSNFASGTGQTVNITKDSVLKFSIVVSNDSSVRSAQSTKTENHTITINEVTADRVLITIASEPQQYSLRAHQSILVDVNGDSKKDLGIEVTSITPPTASFRIWRIIPIIPTATAAQIQKTVQTRDLLRVLSVILGAIIIMLMLPNSFFGWILARFGRGDHHHHGRPGGSGPMWGGPYAPEPIHVKHHSNAQPSAHGATLAPIAINVVDNDQYEQAPEESEVYLQISQNDPAKAENITSESID